MDYRGLYLDLLVAARDVRRLQKRYFKTRTKEDLIACKQAERVLDGLVADTLFEQAS
jgi:hypothetical protein